MKKTIFIELLLLFNLAICLELDIRYFSALPYGYRLDYYAYLNFIATITLIVSMILIAIKDFPVFKPLRDKINSRRERHAQAKAEKAEQDKQEKIKALEQQLEELKRDGE